MDSVPPKPAAEQPVVEEEVKLASAGFNKKRKRHALFRRYVNSVRKKSKKARKDFNLRTTVRSPKKCKYERSIHYGSESERKMTCNDSNLRMPFISKTDFVKNSKLEKRWDKNFANNSKHHVLQSRSGLTYNNKGSLPEIMDYDSRIFSKKKGSVSHIRSRRANQIDKSFKPLTSREYLEKFKNQSYGTISEYGQTPNEIFASFLRTRFIDRTKRNKSLAVSKSNDLDKMIAKIKKKEKKWNHHFALPISNYNEKVFIKYRLMFDKIKKVKLPE
ncbi:unnamed protein product [Moneuplotes crassus]|uniref:Uncharacterized protein n=1 Tax=Euplotes crassus TaxID=5936 RepID=A0AAD1XLI0_EUPCR|nr:unnamed protein product [Moneuplotes crassus]